MFENKHVTVNDFLKRKEAIGRRKRTLNKYSRTLREFFPDRYADKTPAEITVEDIEDYITILDDRGCVQNTKRRYLETLSAFHTWAVKRPRFDTITGDPAGVVLEELPKQVHDRPDCATWEHGKQIVHAIGDPRDKLVTVLLAKTGCRVSEALKIRMEDLLLDEGFIRLRERKGGKQGVVPVDQETIQALERYRLVRGDPDTDHLFVSIRGQPLGRRPETGSRG